MKNFNVCVWKPDNSIRVVKSFDSYNEAKKHLLELHSHLIWKGYVGYAENLFIQNANESDVFTSEHCKNNNCEQCFKRYRTAVALKN